MMDWHDPEPLLERFRHWLSEIRSEAERLPPEPASPPEHDGQASPAMAAMADVVAALTALRHEVKLETKSTRGLQEQVESLVGELTQAISRFDSAQADEDKAARTAAEPLAQTLADLDEALERGRRAVEQARRQALEELHARGPAEFDMMFYAQWFWQRWKSRPFYRTIRQKWLQEMIHGQQEIWEGLVQGYQLVQNRLKRAMDAQGLERLSTVGQAVDPHTMTVLEIVEAPQKPPGTVVDEVRPGYLWKGRLLRLAEVRAVRSAPAEEIS